MEKLFKDEVLKLSNHGNGKTVIDILQNKPDTVYFINNDKEKELDVYIFSSEDERKKAKQEYDDKTAAASLTYQELYETKNVIVIVHAGNQQNEYYSKVASAMEKIKTQ